MVEEVVAAARSRLEEEREEEEDEGEGGWRVGLAGEVGESLSLSVRVS